ncbi:hypothetical protein [Micromonospora sp. NPDC049301]
MALIDLPRASAPEQAEFHSSAAAWRAVAFMGYWRLGRADPA